MNTLYRNIRTACEIDDDYSLRGFLLKIKEKKEVPIDIVTTWIDVAITNESVDSLKMLYSFDEWNYLINQGMIWDVQEDEIDSDIIEILSEALDKKERKEETLKKNSRRKIPFGFRYSSDSNQVDNDLFMKNSVSLEDFMNERNKIIQSPPPPDPSEESSLQDLIEEAENYYGCINEDGDEDNSVIDFL